MDFLVARGQNESYDPLSWETAQPKAMKFVLAAPKLSERERRMYSFAVSIYLQ